MDKDQFNAMMDTIDSVLSLNGVPIHARSAQAVPHISRSYGIEFIFAPPPLPPLPGRYDTLTMSSHIGKWYRDRYGDRVNLSLDDRRVVIVIKNELWCLTLPILFGRFKAICDPDMERYKHQPRLITTGEPMVINVLNSIKHMTFEIGKILSNEEQRQILSFFMDSLNFMQDISFIENKPYIKEAMSDLQASVNHLIGVPSHFGQSKWASLQMVEKFIKSYLRIKNIPFPKNHNLQGLASLAIDHGLKAIGDQVLQEVACKAKVRYGEVAVARDEAVRAHHASLRACSALLPQIQKA